MDNKVTRSSSAYREAAFLATCSEDAAIAWLRDRPLRLSPVTGTPVTPQDSHLLEYVLLRRREAAIDLALAQHGRSRTVMNRVYRRGSDSVKVVACSNASLFVGDPLDGLRGREEDLLWEIIRAGPISQVRAICENPHLRSRFYVELIEAWQPRDRREEGKIYLPESRYLAILNCLSVNPRVSQSREKSAERNYMDGHAEYLYNAFYTEAWALAQTAPVTSEWAHALARLFRKLYVPFKCIDNVEAVVERWRPAGESEYAARYVREALAAAFMEPSIEQLNHVDQAMRNAFYQTFDPDAKEFRDLDWDAWIDRDRNIYYDIYANDKVWASALGRSKLESMLRHGSSKDSDLTTVGFYRKRTEELAEQHPDWFADSVLTEEEEATVDPVAQLRREIRSLVGTLKWQQHTALSICGAAVAGIIVGVLIG
jgi:hypothetical protein